MHIAVHVAKCAAHAELGTGPVSCCVLNSLAMTVCQDYGVYLFNRLIIATGN